MVELLHSYLSQPYLTSKDIFVHALNILTKMIKQAPPTICNAQFQSIDDLQQIFYQWHSPEETNPKLVPLLAPREAQTPRVPIATWAHA